MSLSRVRVGSCAVLSRVRVGSCARACVRVHVCVCRAHARSAARRGGAPSSWTSRWRCRGVHMWTRARTESARCVARPAFGTSPTSTPSKRSAQTRTLAVCRCTPAQTQPLPVAPLRRRAAAVRVAAWLVAVYEQPEYGRQRSSGRCDGGDACARDGGQAPDRCPGGRERSHAQSHRTRTAATANATTSLAWPGLAWPGLA